MRELEKRSDGVVSYSSAHLAGAALQKIVPSGHGAPGHWERTEELRRISRLHDR